MDIISVYAPAHLDPYDSYGLIACELLRNLDALGVYVNAVALGEPRHTNQPTDIAALTNRPIRPSLGGVLLGYPTTWQHHGPLAHVGGRIAITMFESSKIPPDWIEPLNQMDAVIVPSTFCRDSFVECGVTVPIYVVPLGVSEIYTPAPRSGDRPYTFLAFGDRGRRKNALEAIHAFHLEFGDDPNYRLVIKSRDLDNRTNVLNENIDIIYQDMTVEELYQLYLSTDCMLFPSRGEGFGLPPREFAATGAPVIATNWSGLADDIEVWGIPLGYTLAPADWQGAKNLQGLDLGVWADPDLDDLQRLMRHVADNRELYAARAIESAPQVKELYSWVCFAQAVYDIWKGVINGK